MLHMRDNLSEVNQSPASETPKTEPRIEITPFKQNHAAINGLLSQKIKVLEEIPVHIGSYLDCSIGQGQLQACGEKGCEMQRREPAYNERAERSRIRLA